jgi:hypothetical protein
VIYDYQKVKHSNIAFNVIILHKEHPPCPISYMVAALCEVGRLVPGVHCGLVLKHWLLSFGWSILLMHLSVICVYVSILGSKVIVPC